jgi:hypothetical protein
VQAAVATRLAAPLEIHDRAVPDPGPGQVLVRLQTTGLYARIVGAFVVAVDVREGIGSPAGRVMSWRNFSTCMPLVEPRSFPRFANSTGSTKRSADLTIRGTLFVDDAGRCISSMHQMAVRSNGQGRDEGVRFGQSHYLESGGLVDVSNCGGSHWI